MQAYYVVPTKNINFDKLSYNNVICLSSNLKEAIESRDQFSPDGVVMKIDMDEEDVILAIQSGLTGGFCEVKFKFLEIC